MTDPAAASPFIRIGPEQPLSPVILSVPHAGRAYSAELLKSARLPRMTLETLEDRLVDQLVWRATAAGATAFVALTPRAEIDLNRDEREIDPVLIAPPLPSSQIVQSARARGGIGLIPSRIAGAGAIWRQRIPREELQRRISETHRPYHQALEKALEAARERFGAAVLLDCHSMPPRGRQTLADGERAAAVIFGDRHGTSIAPDLLAAAVSGARELGYATACNAPYAGGHVVGRHGRPAEDIHALQIELDRSVYLDVELRDPGPGFDRACQLILAVVKALEAQLLAPEQAIAAE
ncbi:MAG TPA: N-formylglutamate amidohydrolase [Allosphingosinicella sp.]|nr:N-formylglutamate amidohydrolase [Allosphingosinicella sp.]